MSATTIFGAIIGLVAIAGLVVLFLRAGGINIPKISNFENENNNGPAASADMSNGAVAPSSMPMPVAPKNGSNTPMPPMNNEEGFANDEASESSNGGPASMPFAAANKPTNCYPKIQLNPTELLPSDPNSKWEQVNPQGAGDIAGKNYLNAGALIGVNTVGQSLRNASYDLRSEPANPQVAVSPWFNSTIEPDTNRKTFEIA